MKRRNFLKNLLSASAAPLMLNGIPVRALADTMMAQLSTCAEVQDRALVLIQLHGGNDGLNTVLPVNQYSTYLSLRPNIALPNSGSRKFINLDTSLQLVNQVGIHPDMTAMKALYDQGKVNVIQGAGYPNNNKSHFKATDIWMTGADSTAANTFTSGWMGRYLNHTFPNYPAAYPHPQMPDPLGMELGSRYISLGYHMDGVGSMGLALSGDPSSFYTLVSGVGGPLPQYVPPSHFGEKLQMLIDSQNNGNDYAKRVDQVYNAGSNHPSVTYPVNYYTSSSFRYKNELAPQLKTIARLISGGSKTKVFLVRLTGFDTHTNQADSTDPSKGKHAVLLYHLSTAIKAFQDDLAAQSLDDKVMTVTFSEFGRRAAENGNNGTDHGTLAPMFVIGSGVNGGVSGANSNLGNLSGNNLQGLQNDYRQVYTTLLQDWLGASNQALTDTYFDSFKNQKIPFIQSSFIAGSTCYLTPFPVGLLAFDARVEKDGKVLCDWRTATELNNDFFTLERSKDGELYEEMGKIPGAGTSSTAQSYQWPDPLPHLGISYYRLRQTDFDGATTFYPPVSVQVFADEQPLTYRAFPNPATDFFTLEVNSLSAVGSSLGIYNLRGQLIREYELELADGLSRHKVDTHELSQGIYLIRLATHEGEEVSFRQMIR